MSKSPKGKFKFFPLALMVIAIIALFAVIKSSKTDYTSAPNTNTSTNISTSTALAISILPAQIVQGDPVLIEVSGTSSLATISLENKPLKTFSYSGGEFALAPIDLNARTGLYFLNLKFSDGSATTTSVMVGKRKVVTAPLGIPSKLGGNTPASEQELVATLIEENASLVGIPTASRALWSKPFVYPVADPVVTDIYGYTRQTGSVLISHKGTDFRAPEGTPVMAINTGIVRLVKTFRDYGETIVVDHGLGLMSFYMHLSRIDVRVGDTVERGQTIGLSGQTGYAAEPHLHLTIRINDISIDPAVFLKLFNK